MPVSQKATLWVKASKEEEEEEESGALIETRPLELVVVIANDDDW